MIWVGSSIANASATLINYPGSFSADHQPPGATITCAGDGGHCGTLNDVTCIFTDVNGNGWRIDFPIQPPTPEELAVFKEAIHTVGVYATPAGCGDCE